MQHNNNPVFNVIFIPNTVDYQSIALISLLQNSDLSFRLVGNGLKAKEAMLLEQISQTSSRLSFINYESQSIIPHGTLLDLLMLSESSDLFCFCDSDLFLFKPLKLDNLMDELGDSVVFSSGGRIENEDSATYAGFKGGATTISPDRKIDLATSFFCLYRRQKTEQVMSESHVGFEQYRTLTQIPAHIRSKVTDLIPEFDMFDTGKLLSLLLHLSGFSKVYRELDGLAHIGGMSGRYLQKLDLSTQVVLEESELPEVSITKNEKFNMRNEYEKSLKRLYGKYFFSFLNHLIGKGPKPILNADTPRIVKTIDDLEKNIRKVIRHAKHDPVCKEIWSLIAS